MAKPRVDPFTMEIIKDALVAIGDEMFVATQRTSMSTIIYEVLDYACGLTDHKAQLIAQGNGVAGFLGTLTFGVQSVIDKFGLDGLEPGDIILQNDPYTGGGTHLSDVAQIMPIFYDGKVVAFSANKGHWTEVGGKDTGSWTTDATEVYQEGLQFPCIKLYKGGELDQSLADLIAANVRTPEMTLGDMFAQAASLRLGAKRFQEMCDRYGLELVQAGIEALMDYGEEMTRKELAKLPRGVYEAVDYIDDDGVGNGPFKVCVKVTITDDEFICDFTGTHPQVPGPVNCSRTGLHSGGRTIFKALTNPSIPANEGCFRPLKIICPDRTIFTCERPAATSTYWETMLYVTDLVWKAMAPVVPERLPAGHFLSVCGIVLSGEHPDTGELFILCEPQAGGWGAGHDKDGEGGLVCVGDGETYIIPVEVCETRYGVLVDQYGFDICEGGAGRHRGGRGLVRDYRITADEAWYTGTFGRHKFRPWAMAGGQEGSPNYTQFIFADGREPVVVGKSARVHLKKGDVARLITATGGGWGDPHERPVEEVQRDVRDGYITVEMAEKDYGVIVDPHTLGVTCESGGYQGNTGCSRSTLSLAVVSWENRAMLEGKLAGLKPMTEDISPITVEERQGRIEKARALMVENDIAAICLEAGSSLFYFTGVRWERSERMMAAVMPAKGEIAYVCPAFEEARLRELIGFGGEVRVWEEDESPYEVAVGIFRDRGITGGRIGIEESVRFFLFDGIRKEAPHLEFVSADPVTIPCRAVKSRAEIALMQRASDITVEAYKVCLSLLREGMSQDEFTANSVSAYKALGVKGEIHCQFGESTAYPHGSSELTYLKEGDVVLMDGWCTVEGYHSDVSRTIVFGEPTQRQRDIWNLEKEAQAAAFAAAQVGVPCEEVDAAARKVITDAGLGPGYKVPGLPHRTGHGIGLDIHEWYHLVRGNKVPIAPGMCFSNEPMIAIYGKFGVRLEDCMTITEDGPRFFTQPSPSIKQPFA